MRVSSLSGVFMIHSYMRCGGVGIGRVEICCFVRGWNCVGLGWIGIWEYWVF